MNDEAFEAWLSEGVDLLEAVETWRWRVGDWLVAGDALEPAAGPLGSARVRREVCARTVAAPQDLERLRFVAERFPPSARRRGLSWQHHDVVAKLPPNAAAELLDAAAMGDEPPPGVERHPWPVDRLRRAAREWEAAR